MAGTADLVIRVITDTTKATGDLDSAGGKFSKFGSGIKKAMVPAIAALGAIAAGAIAAGNAAAEDAQAQAILAKNLKNTTGATDKQVAQTEDYIAAMSAATGVADDSLRPAMATLAGATGDVDKAQRQLHIALNVAAASGKDVEAVSKAMAKAQAGSTGSLKKLVPALDDATLASKDTVAIMEDLEKKTKGAAAAAADTAAGKMAKMQNAMSEAKEEIGTALLPVMAKLSDFLAKVARFAQRHPGLFRAVAAAVAALAAAIIVLNIAMSIYTAVTSAAGAAMLAALGPILLIVAGVALLVAGIILLWKKSETFRAIVVGVWDAVKFAARAYFEYVKFVAGIVLAFLKTAWKALEPVVVAVWERIKTVAGAVADWVKEKWQLWFPIIKKGFEEIRDKGTEAWEKIKPKVQDVIDKVRDFYNNYMKPVIDFVEEHKDSIAAVFTSALGPIGALIDKLQELNDWLDKVASKGKGVKAGTDVPEPDTRSRAVVGGYAAPGVRSSGRAAVTGQPVIINVTGALDPEAVARQIRRILAGHDRRVGVRVT